MSVGKSFPKELKLEEAYWFQEGPGVRNWQFADAGIKLLNVGNIEKNGTLNLGKTSRYLNEEEAHSKYKHFLCDDGDLVIASSGIGFDEDGLLRTRGAFVQQRHLPLCMNTSTIRFKSKNNNDLSYLKHWLQSNSFRKQITKLVTGSAQKNFGPSHLKKIQIPLPVIEEQHRIANILDKANQIKRKRELASEKLDLLADSIFMDMFGDVTQWAPLKTLVNKKGNDLPYEGSEIWSLSLEHIESVSGRLIKKVVIPKDELGSSTYFFSPPAVLYSKLRPYLNKVLIPAEQGYATTELVPLYCDENVIRPIFLAAYLRSKRFVEFANTNSGGAKMPRVMMDKFWNHLIPKPSIDQQIEFENLMKSISKNKDNFMKSNNIYSKMLSALEAQAFTGQL